MSLARLDGALTASLLTATGQAVVRDGNGLSLGRRLGFWDISWSGAIPSADGTAYASMVDSSTLILDAIATATALNVPVRGQGTYRIDAPIVIAIDCDFTGATFVVSNAAQTAVRAGTSTPSTAVRRKRMILPLVKQAAKITTGWTGASIGVELANLSRCEVTLQHIQSFVTGLLLTTYGTIGCDYNTIIGGHRDNNKVNEELRPGSTNGWCNENTFLNPSYSHDSGEGTAVAGTRHILLSSVGASQPNNNLWVKPSLESPGVVEFEIESIGGIYNRWIQGRYEHTGDTPKVWWNQLDATRFSRDNAIDGGYNAAAIVFTVSANSARNRLWSETKNVTYGASSTVAAQRYVNATSDTGPQIEGVDLSVDPLTAAAADWRWRITAAAAAVKAKADTVARWSISTALGVLTWSDGSAAGDTNLYRNGPNQLKTDDRFIATDGVTPKVKAGAIVDGDFASTPADGTMGIDTTNSKIMVRIGGAWRSVVVS